MTTVRSVTSDDLRVIVCVAFDHRAAPRDIAGCKAAIINCPSVLHSMELSGTFDFMFEGTVPDMAAYNAQLTSCAGAVAKFASRYEANFVCQRFVRAEDAEEAVWVPSDDGLVRIDRSRIDKVRAEGDYVCVHSDGVGWMLHTTMRRMLDKLGGEDFVQLHRSAIVRWGFIERLRHEGRLWTARLADGSEERIAKSHVATMLSKFRDNSSTSQPALTLREGVVELSAKSERLMDAQAL